MKYKGTTATASVKRSCDQEGEGEGKGRGHLLLPLLSLEFGTRQKKRYKIFFAYPSTRMHNNNVMVEGQARVANQETSMGKEVKEGGIYSINHSPHLCACRSLSVRRSACAMGPWPDLESVWECGPAWRAPPTKTKD